MRGAGTEADRARDTFYVHDSVHGYVDDYVNVNVYDYVYVHVNDYAHIASSN